MRLARRLHSRQPELTVSHLISSMLTNVRSGVLVFASVFALATVSASAQEPRVRAKEPTVVTVEGKRGEVKPETAQTKAADPPQNVLRRTVNGIGHAFVVVGRGIGSWVGGVFNGDDVIPSEAERRQAKERKQR